MIKLLAAMLYVIAPMLGATLSFESLTQVGSSIALIESPFVSAGFSVSDSSGQFLMWQADSENYFGVTGLAPSFTDSITTVSRVGGGEFSLIFLDVAKLFDQIADPQSLLVVGTTIGGITVSQSCVIGVASTYGRCVFGPEFASLTTVYWANDSLFQYSAIGVTAGSTAVPEPSMMLPMLMLLTGNGVVRILRARLIEQKRL